MASLHDLQKQINDNARAHGFYDDRDLGDETRESMNALTHSELSEALECVRKGELEACFFSTGSGLCYKPNLTWTESEVEWSKTLKPVGLPSEIADTVIRVLDFAHHFSITFAEPDRPAIGEYKRPTPRSAAAWIAQLHRAVADEDVAFLLQQCYNFASAYGFDLDEAILLKHSYNITRPVMHGNKTL